MRSDPAAGGAHAPRLSYLETVRCLLRLGSEGRGAKLGLERMERLLERLDHPERAFPSVHIAGTNGKGSTAALAEAGLRAAGFRAGLYTSPHLVRINERIQTGGQEISDADFCLAVQPVFAAVEQLLAEGTIDGHPSFFECVTAAAFCHFRRSAVEYAVIEVGLGGRLDATNLVWPKVTVITPIDFDHEAFLGNKTGAIAAEKAGIFKRGVPAVLAPQRREAQDALEARRRQLGIPAVEVGSDWRAEQVTHRDGYYRFVAAGPAGKTVRAELGLAGEHQVTNALTAIAALDLLGVDAGAIEVGVRNARWPGRLERVGDAPLLLLDGAHNPAGARALVRYLTQHQAGRRVWLIYAALRDKAVEEVAGILFPTAHQVLLTGVSQPRGLRPEALAAIAGHHHPRWEIAGNLSEALARARARAGSADLILVTGSLFLVGEAKAILG